MLYRKPPESRIQLILILMDRNRFLHIESYGREEFSGSRKVRYCYEIKVRYSFKKKIKCKKKISYTSLQNPNLHFQRYIFIRPDCNLLSRSRVGHKCMMKFNLQTPETIKLQSHNFFILIFDVIWQSNSMNYLKLLCNLLSMVCCHLKLFINSSQIKNNDIIFRI